MKFIFEHPSYGWVKLSDSTDTKLLNVEADTAGEFLRGWCFGDPHSIRDMHFGGYTTFEPRNLDEWLKVPMTESDFQCIFQRESDFIAGKDPDLYYTDTDIFKDGNTYVHRATDIRMTLWWDGDGSLGFLIPAKEHSSKARFHSISNNDCKRSYGWEWGEMIEWNPETYIDDS